MVFGLKKKKTFPNGDNRFFDLLTRQSAKTVEGLEALWFFAENGNRESTNAVRNIEQEADELSSE